ncbi:aspartyl-phosphate phosphatase Spo0E family protein [Desertibacillus haloalkaliphilus]|uniref:aspartyl-phosphate phosphatase Spo0E family protein n=1 Tax=Desertibacillus haloalkaliphilus TaxID=1328930 RepID=UPI001FE79288|nr:aspartyl-phosphate phosphatase Spo0E family protein [Desertibacillus haloalkaliphilus]
MVKTDYDDRTQLEMLRKKMVTAALIHGMNHPLVLKYSQQIDEKHNVLLKNSYVKESEMYSAY